MAETARHIAAKAIALIERQGGLMVLPCGCIVGVRAKEMRKLIEVAGPESFNDALNTIQCPDHPEKPKRKSRAKSHAKSERAARKS